jgi:DNA-binding NarL/FixJ family response regulator
MPFRAIVAGDAEPFLEALTTLLLDLDDRLEIVGWARNDREAVQLVRQVLPDLALVSADTPPVDGIAVTRELLAANPTCRVIVFGPDGSPLEIERALLAGAAGYVTLDPVGIDLIALAIGAQEAQFGASESRSAGSLAEPASSPSGKRNLRRL